VAEDLIRKSRELPKVGWDDWLKDFLIESADQFLRIRSWMLMPNPETYRQHYRIIEAAAAHLLEEMKKPPLSVAQPFDSQLLGLTGFYLREDGPRPNDNHLHFDNFERMLTHVISACRECFKIEGAAGARGRRDLLFAAAASADLWTELSGCRFPKSVAVIETVGGANPGFPEFKSPGPRFVAELLRAFDPDATFAEVRTALKGLPAESRVQE
jgi:hypothetical protein